MLVQKSMVLIVVVGRVMVFNPAPAERIEGRLHIKLIDLSEAGTEGRLHDLGGTLRFVGSLWVAKMARLAALFEVGIAIESGNQVVRTHSSFAGDFLLRTSRGHLHVEVTV